MSTSFIIIIIMLLFWQMMMRFGIAQRRGVSTFALVRGRSPNPVARRFEAADGRLSFLRPSASGAGVQLSRDDLENRPQLLAELASPGLASAVLMRAEGSTLLVSRDFVAVTAPDDSLDDEEEWDAMQQAMETALEADLGDGKWREVLLQDAPGVAEPGLEPQGLEAEIEALLDAKVRPNLQADGGDVEFRGVDADGTARLRLVGACQSCPSSTVTLKFMISNLLTFSFPDGVKRVEQVFDEGDLVEGKGEGWTG